VMFSWRRNSSFAAWSPCRRPERRSYFFQKIDISGSILSCRKSQFDMDALRRVSGEDQIRVQRSPQPGLAPDGHRSAFGWRPAGFCGQRANVLIHVQRAPICESIRAIGGFCDLDTCDALRLGLQGKPTSCVDLTLRPTVRAARRGDVTTERGARGSTCCRCYCSDEHPAQQRRLTLRVKAEHLCQARSGCAKSKGASCSAVELPRGVREANDAHQGGGFGGCFRGADSLSDVEAEGALALVDLVIVVVVA
jgi:hypothetical protein